MKPKVDKEQEIIFNSIENHLWRLKHIFPEDGIILGGDWNLSYIKRTNKLSKELGLTQIVQGGYIINAERGTHQDGNILDEIYTNLRIKKAELMDLNFSDHKAVVTDLIWEIKDDYEIDQEQEKYIRKKDLVDLWNDSTF
jgi:hypothetical protein